jgi:1-acyl-sn-glycerol-3-phosphate acyltransferase
MSSDKSNLPSLTTQPVSDDLISKTLMPLAKAFQLYHRHEVIGLGHVPRKGRCLVVCNHSLATYDIFLLCASIYQSRSRIVRPLIDRTFFRFPGLGEFMTWLGAVQGSQGSAKSLLGEDNIVCVAPGGMRESLRPSTERYQIRWDRRMGFARLAMETGTPIVLAACPKADDIYEVYPNPLTTWTYNLLRLPLPIARGVGLSALPRPVKLVHYLSEPIQPPKPLENEEAFKKQLQRFHHRLVKRMETLIGEAIQHRG